MGEIRMRMIAYLLALICVIAAVMYFTMQAGSLPTFMPGYAEGSTHIHHTHALAAAVAAVVLLGIGWLCRRPALSRSLISRRRRPPLHWKTAVSIRKRWHRLRRLWRPDRPLEDVEY